MPEQLCPAVLLIYLRRPNVPEQRCRQYSMDCGSRKFLWQATAPPPPIGTKIACKSRLKCAGQWRRISKPIVPCSNMEELRA